MRQKLEMVAAAVLLILAIIFAWGCATLPVQKGVIRVQVTVVDRETNTPLQGATVSCNGRVMITGQDGKTFFNDVPVGLMRLYIRKTGYWDLGSQNYKETDQVLTAHLRKVK